MIVFIVHVAAVWLVSRYIPQANVNIPGSAAITQVLGTAGVAIAILATALFRRSSTTVDPMKPETASSLVTTGVYRYSRNPMYLGLALILTAWALWKSNWGGFIFIPSFITYMTINQIKPEEQALLDNFGEEYQEYKRQVRRWI